VALKIPLVLFVVNLECVKLLLTLITDLFLYPVDAMFQEEGSASDREWTDKMQSQDRCVLIL
jgi:hypothetical protein